ncbi:Permease of the drug/metabolite transporter (DMT) superfamily [Paenibacillus uliginis N3/975]|uniref:Permease of the drug/metabolite transporter (DMT) superfamily n=1 Tax=Paenibacillus uliginis N3/975 TaxID=1313296 RepID=A0A1X7HJD2_9BACL|nr:Permease of the drug/metabolite transporter (DMT) superfamily [Paenibacillus uliginis N3/975]
MPVKSKLPAYVAAFINALIIGLSFLFVKIALESANPIDALAHRFTISFVVILIPVLFGLLKLNIRLKDIVSILPLAIFYPTLFFGLQVFGLVSSSSSEAGIILALSPIFTVLLAGFFLKEHTSVWQKYSVLLSVTGVIYIFVMKGTSLDLSNFKGLALLVLSALSMAIYSVLARPLTKKFKPMELTFVMLMIGFIVFNGVSVSKHVWNGSMHEYFQPFTSSAFVLSTLYLGVLSSLVTSLMSNFALSRIEASKMSVFSNLSTLISMLAGILFLQEELGYYHIIGAVMILAGVLGVNFLDPARRKQTGVTKAIPKES